MESSLGLESQPVQSAVMMPKTDVQELVSILLSRGKQKQGQVKLLLVIGTETSQLRSGSVCTRFHTLQAQYGPETIYSLTPITFTLRRCQLSLRQLSTVEPNSTSRHGLQTFTNGLPLLAGTASTEDLLP